MSKKARASKVSQPVWGGYIACPYSDEELNAFKAFAGDITAVDAMASLVEAVEAIGKVSVEKRERGIRATLSYVDVETNTLYQLTAEAPSVLGALAFLGWKVTLLEGNLLNGIMPPVDDDLWR